MIYMIYIYGKLEIIYEKVKINLKNGRKKS